MNSNDIFEIIGETPERYVLDAASVGVEVIPAQPHSPKRIWLIAAMIAVMLLLMGSAVAALVRMRVDDVKTYWQDGKKQEGEKDSLNEVQESEQDSTPKAHEDEKDNSNKVYEGEKVNFDKVHDTFIELGPYYPQTIPDGYAMTFVSEGAPLQNQVIHYENDAGNLIKFWIYIGDPASSIEIYGIQKKTDVDIGGKPGILYEQEGGARTLVWIDEKLVYGFALRVNDASVALTAMAESTAEGEYLVPTRSDKTLEALEELGDFSPEYLPDGFTEQGVQGSPRSEGSGWYSYVRKWYVNRAENTRIYFEYESYAIVTKDGYTDDARTACSFYIPGYISRRDEIVAEDVEINGMFGIMTENDIAWVDLEARKVYHLHSEDVTGDELLKVAQSVFCNP
jgi:hypothetical protein